MLVHVTCTSSIMVGQSGHSVQIQQLFLHDPLRFGVWVAQLDSFSPMKFEHHQLYSISKMEDQNIALCARDIFYLLGSLYSHDEEVERGELILVYQKCMRGGLGRPLNSHYLVV